MANLLLRVIIAIPLVLMLILILVAGGQVQEPIYNATNDSAGADTGDLGGAEKAFGQSQTADSEDAIMQFTVVSGIALVLVVLGWMITGDLTSDVNQGRRRQF